MIHPNPFLNGRYLEDNITQVLETTENCEKSVKPGLVFISDFEKAFDKVRLEFIYKWNISILENTFFNGLKLCIFTLGVK